MISVLNSLMILEQIQLPENDRVGEKKNDIFTTNIDYYLNEVESHALWAIRAAPIQDPSLAKPIRISSRPSSCKASNTHS